MATTVWMKHGRDGQPKEVEYVHEEIVRLMVAGWVQCAPPANGSQKASEAPSAGETTAEEKR